MSCASTRRTARRCGGAITPGVPHHLHANSSFASVTPAVDAERVFVAWSDPDFTRLMALDHKGNELWTINLGSWISQHGFGCSPMLYQDLVVLNCSQEDSKRPGDPQPKESFIVAVEQSTGNIRWRTDRKIDSASYSVRTVRKNEAGEDELLCNTQGEGCLHLTRRRARKTGRCPCFRCGRSVVRCMSPAWCLERPVPAAADITWSP